MSPGSLLRRACTNCQPAIATTATITNTTSFVSSSCGDRFVTTGASGLPQPSPAARYASGSATPNRTGAEYDASIAGAVDVRATNSAGAGACNDAWHCLHVSQVSGT